VRAGSRTSLQTGPCWPTPPCPAPHPACRGRLIVAATTTTVTDAIHTSPPTVPSLASIADQAARYLHRAPRGDRDDGWRHRGTRCARNEDGVIARRQRVKHRYPAMPDRHSSGSGWQHEDVVGGKDDVHQRGLDLGQWHRSTAERHCGRDLRVGRSRAGPQLGVGCPVALKRAALKRAADLKDLGSRRGCARRDSGRIRAKRCQGGVDGPSTPTQPRLRRTGFERSVSSALWSRPR
jgi:hypothetical protein